MLAPETPTLTIRRTERPCPNFNALERRLLTICSTAVGSHHPRRLRGGATISTPSVPGNVVSNRFTVERTVAAMSVNRGLRTARPARCNSVTVSINSFRRCTSERTTRSAGIMTLPGTRAAHVSAMPR
jgi:hypothetical protein